MNEYTERKDEQRKMDEQQQAPETHEHKNNSRDKEKEEVNYRWNDSRDEYEIR